MFITFPPISLIEKVSTILKVSEEQGWLIASSALTNVKLILIAEIVQALIYLDQGTDDIPIYNIIGRTKQILEAKHGYGGLYSVEAELEEIISVLREKEIICG